MDESQEHREAIRQERESRELIAKLETENGPDLLLATKQFLAGYRHVAKETDYLADIDVTTAYVDADEHMIKSEVFKSPTTWDTDTNLLGSWRVDIGTTQGSPSLLSETPAEYIVTLKHTPPDKTEDVPKDDPETGSKDFVVEFAVSAGKVSALNIHHPLSSPGHEIKIKRSQVTTVKYAIHTLNQLGTKLMSFKK